MDSTTVGSVAFILLVSGGVSVGGLEDTDGVICGQSRLNSMVHCQPACREAFAFYGLGGSTGYDAPDDIRHL